jgi:hypothetical protein
MLYIVIASFANLRQTSVPMSYDDALGLVHRLHADGVSAHIEHFHH